MLVIHAYLIARLILGQVAPAAIAATLLFAFFGACWFALPRLLPPPR